MKARTRWLGCDACGVLRDHSRAIGEETSKEMGQVGETWVCTICNSKRLLSKAHSDYAERELLEQRVQLRLLD